MGGLIGSRMEKKKAEKQKRNLKQEKGRKKGNNCKKKVWKGFGCLIFEQKFKVVRSILPKDSPLNSERFDI